MAQKSNRFKTVYLPLFIVSVFTFAMYIAVEELLSSQGEYRVTIWDILNGRGEVPEGRAEVSTQVAIQVCKGVAQQQMGPGLIQADFDQRSSRYSEQYKVHTIFLDLRIRGRDNEDLYIRCDISAVNRVLLESRVQGERTFGLF